VALGLRAGNPHDRRSDPFAGLTSMVLGLLILAAWR
jgi:hypothetical protein